MAEMNPSTSTDLVVSSTNAEPQAASAVEPKPTATDAGGEDKGEMSQEDINLSNLLKSIALERTVVFTGEWEHSSVHEFIKDIRSKSKLGKWTDEETLAIAVFKLEGEAFDFYETLFPRPETFEDFARSLIERFEGSFEKLATVKLLYCKQKYGQKVKDFASKILKLTHRAYASGNASLSVEMMDKIRCMHFVGGVLPHIKYDLVDDGYKNFQDAVRIAGITEMCCKEEKVIKEHLNRMADEMDDLEAHLEHVRNQSKARDQGSAFSKSNVRCWNCQKRGHKASQCRYRH